MKTFELKRVRGAVCAALSVLLALVLSLSLAGCAQNQEGVPVLRVGASSTPHAEILEQVKEDLAAAGYTLEIVTYDDYVLPNTDLQNGSLDANYFQHTPYLNSFNKANGTTLASAASIHYEPFGLYGNGIKSLSEAPAGATIFIPADDSNETRALLLLAQEGLITLPADASAAKGVNHLDIVDSKGYSIQPVEASTVPAQLRNAGEGTLAVINGNYAIGAGLKIADALATENADGDAAQTYANIIAVREGRENEEGIRALVNALKTEKIRNFLKEKYAGAVVAVF
ncbi:MAG: metal ABC transporter substrate-binding protein [Clostridia bacterium]|nr:metal ABC transporter substrate-binding protein [Clostridia bacterium]